MNIVMKADNPVDIDMRTRSISLTPQQQQRIQNGEGFWIYGFVRYRNFMEEVWEQRFILRWKPLVTLADLRVGFLPEGPEPYNRLVQISGGNLPNN